MKARNNSDLFLIMKSHQNCNLRALKRTKLLLGMNYYPTFENHKMLLSTNSIQALILMFIKQGKTMKHFQA